MDSKRVEKNNRLSQQSRYIPTEVHTEPSAVINVGALLGPLSETNFKYIHLVMYYICILIYAYYMYYVHVSVHAHSQMIWFTNQSTENCRWRA